MSDQTYRADRPYRQYDDGRRFAEQESGANALASSVIDAAQKNPIGAALVGMGLAWLFAGARAGRLADRVPAAAGRALSAGGSVMADMARSTGDAVGNASEYVKGAGASALRQAADLVGSTANRMGEAVGSGADQAGDMAGSIADTLRTTGSRAVADLAASGRSQLGQMLHEQPLLLAAGAFAVGAAMAASLPLTRTEERVLGDLAENAMQPGENGDSIGDRLQSAATAAKEGARRQGLMPDALKQQAAELRDRVTGAIGS